MQTLSSSQIKQAGGLFLQILLDLLSELLCILSDGCRDLIHRIQHQTFHINLQRKKNAMKNTEQTGFKNQKRKAAYLVKPLSCFELKAWSSVHGHLISGQSLCLVQNFVGLPQALRHEGPSGNKSLSVSLGVKASQQTKTVLPIH